MEHDGLITNPVLKLLQTQQGEPPVKGLDQVAIDLYSRPPPEEEWLYNTVKTLATRVAQRGLHNCQRPTIHIRNVKGRIGRTTIQSRLTTISKGIETYILKCDLNADGWLFDDSRTQMLLWIRIGRYNAYETDRYVAIHSHQ